MYLGTPGVSQVMNWAIYLSAFLIKFLHYLDWLKYLLTLDLLCNIKKLWSINKPYHTPPVTFFTAVKTL